jgi:hypothetical protein
MNELKQAGLLDVKKEREERPIMQVTIRELQMTYEISSSAQD